MIIGKNVENGEDVIIDLPKLIATRLLVQANSGGGKSWLLRRINEQLFGKVQQIIIDLEGEFSTLREKFDYLLVGKEGEIPINIQTAELLAKKLLALNVSTIIDLSELKHHERLIFVKRFLDSIVNAPRELWHPCLIYVDEAHQFCPEKAQSESASSVIDLETRGRKRGFCGSLATQRISKLHKDAAAECNNVFVGRTVLDIDRKRAADDLGFTTKEQSLGLKTLEDGEFFVRGPAFAKNEVIKIKVGEILTTHPEPGKNVLKKSETPKNIRDLLKDLIDLPKEVEEELKTKKDFLTKIEELKRENRSLKVTKTKPVADQNLLLRERERGFKEGEKVHAAEINLLKLDRKKLEKKISDIANLAGQPINYSFVEKTVEDKIKATGNHTGGESGFDSHQSASSAEGRTPSLPKGGSSSTLMKDRSDPHFSSIDNVGNGSLEIKLGICERKIYSLLFVNPERGFTKVQISLLTGYSVNSGSFGNAMAKLNSFGLIRKEGNLIYVKDLNSEIATEQGIVFNQENLLNKLGKCSREIMDVLLAEPYREFSKEEISENTVSHYSSNSGSFGNSLAKLNSLQLLVRSNSKIKLNPEFLEL
jgi:hypothetical protein